MKKSPAILIILVLICVSCTETAKQAPPIQPDFSNRTTTINPTDSTLTLGSTYLSVYSDIYSYSEKTRHNLTATISLRNLNEREDFVVTRADYFDTAGNSLKQYVQQPIRIKPLETINLIIDENDEAGGTGANFIFDWAINKGSPEPLFEAVMISTKGQQGLSFVTTGQRIR